MLRSIDVRERLGRLLRVDLVEPMFVLRSLESIEQHRTERSFEVLLQSARHLLHDGERALLTRLALLELSEQRMHTDGSWQRDELMLSRDILPVGDQLLLQVPADLQLHLATRTANRYLVLNCVVVINLAERERKRESESESERVRVREGKEVNQLRVDANCPSAASKRRSYLALRLLLRL